MSNSTPVRLRLPRARRLQNKRDFVSVREQGQRLARGCVILNWRTLPAGSVTRVGVVTSRKVGNAVLRSRARRLLREVFRLHQQQLQQSIDLVLVARPSIVGKKLADVERDFLSALKHVNLINSTQ